VTRGMPAKVFAGCMALSAFAIAIIAGLAADNPSDAILSRALIALVVCYPAGWLIGAVAERAIDEHLRAYARDNPIEAPGGEPLVDRTGGDNPNEGADGLAAA